ncbi:hypothetical protein BCV72DRAFT_310298 [Rhizopus microsporus var. microsporus]|uniref:Uncharacterized protein n=1 Tax=Rhizopus microsporus var. microsporus TaxID=86635 RepID=A0A1X0QN22_RHIZD|nr:hypothetical protein BCV72DRAFT_310298 [Rhizopus microsporus var. microsporus]
MDPDTFVDSIKHRCVANGKMAVMSMELPKNVNVRMMKKDVCLLAYCYLRSHYCLQEFVRELFLKTSPLPTSMDTISSSVCVRPPLAFTRYWPQEELEVEYATKSIEYMQPIRIAAWLESTTPEVRWWSHPGRMYSSL